MALNPNNSFSGLFGTKARWAFPDQRVVGFPQESTSAGAAIRASGKSDLELQPRLLQPVANWTDICPIKNPEFTINSGTHQKWLFNSGWIHDQTNDEADITGSSGASLDQVNVFTQGKKYRVYFTIRNRSAGSINCLVGGEVVLNAAADGNYEVVAYAYQGPDLNFLTVGGFTGSITSVYVEPFETGWNRENLVPGDTVVVQNTQGLQSGDTTGALLVRQPDNKGWLRFLLTNTLTLSS